MRRFIPLALALLAQFCCESRADEIKFRDGRSMTGKVMEYKDGYIKIRRQDGKFVSGKISLIEHILFDDDVRQANAEETGPRVTPAIQREIDRSINQAKQGLEKSTRPAAIVAMYLDTENPRDSIPQKYVEYRCYSGGGYSGIMRIPLRQAWTRLEYVHSGISGNRRIQLDPGPPYEIINREVVLAEGEVTDLGRIVLKKVEADGTASIYGTVKDSAGNVLSNVQISTGSKQTQTDLDGKYVLDGFGLEVVSLKASKSGYFGATPEVSIRNMDNREIKQDLTLFRPRTVRLKYVIGGKKSDSLVGPDVEQGTIELTVDSTRVDLSNRRYSSKNFSNFAADTNLFLSLGTGELTLANFYAPIYFQAAAPGVTFDSITEVGSISTNSQHCPPLKEGSIILIRGFPEGAVQGRSDYCLKILVEELSINQDSN